MFRRHLVDAQSLILYKASVPIQPYTGSVEVFTLSFQPPSHKAGTIFVEIVLWDGGNGEFPVPKSRIYLLPEQAIRLHDDTGKQLDELKALFPQASTDIANPLGPLLGICFSQIFIRRKVIKGQMISEYYPHYSEGADDFVIKYYYNGKYNEILIYLSAHPIRTAITQVVMSVSELVVLREKLKSAYEAAVLGTE